MGYHRKNRVILQGSAPQYYHSSAQVTATTSWAEMREESEGGVIIVDWIEWMMPAGFYLQLGTNDTAFFSFPSSVQEVTRVAQTTMFRMEGLGPTIDGTGWMSESKPLQWRIVKGGGTVPTDSNGIYIFRLETSILGNR